MSVKALGGGGLKVLADMSAKNVSFLGQLPSPISMIISISISICIHTMVGVTKNLNIFMLFPFKVDV